VIQPLFAMIIFAFFFGRVAKLPSDGMPYPLFTYAGLLPWTFFSNAVTNGSQSLMGSANLVTKVYFPRILIPVASVATGFVDFALAFLMLGPLMWWNHTAPASGSLLMIPVTIAIAFLLGLGLSLWLSALIVRYRDVRHIVPFVVQIWMFATPIVYPLSFVPEKWRALVSLNPMVPIVEAFRRSLVGRSVEPAGLAYALVAAMILIASGSMYFRRLERLFADVM
ncbi:MAG TPA: ABC transporter permease, partial [Thermoanaerobaculia bacterium]|nr:ABC transporter permease [Thermoanaerobaculia bacterium]